MEGENKNTRKLRTALSPSRVDVMGIARLVVAGFLLVSLAACDPAPKNSLLGHVSHLGEGRLPVSAVITVELQETAGTETSVIASGGIEEAGPQLPLYYLVEYFPDDIDETNTYAVVARIEDQGTLLYVSDAPTPVTAGDLLNEDGELEVDVVVVPAES
jgi:uncharacterized lipoprotein YbaY